jgi:hypothetical protein
MATQQNPAQQLALEIQKIQQDLLEKQKKLNQIQQTEIEKIVSDFANKVEEASFDKVLVKKMVIEKLTRKHKKRS